MRKKSFLAKVLSFALVMGSMTLPVSSAVAEDYTGTGGETLSSGGISLYANNEYNTIKDISVVSVPDGGFYEYKYFSLSGMVLEFSYSDGSSSQYTMTGNSSIYLDYENISDIIGFYVYDGTDEIVYKSDSYDRSELGAGTYTVVFYNTENVKSEPYSITINEPLTVKKVGEVILSADEFCMNETVSLAGSLINLTYSDGTSEQFSLDWNYKWNSVINDNIYYYIYDETGQTVWTETLSLGNYTVIFFAGTGGAQSSEYNITVTAPDTYTNMALDTGYNVTVSNGDGEWFAYTPSETGTYVFKSYDIINGDPFAYFYNEYTDECDGGGESLNFLMSYNLVAGTTYYFYATSNPYYANVSTLDAEYSVLVYKGKTVESISATLAENEFEIGDVSLIGSELVIKYSDGNISNVTFAYDSQFDETSGKYIYYNVYDKNGEECYGALSAGTYTVEFNIGNVKSASYTITVSAPATTEEMELDKEYAVNVVNNENVWFSYTPSVTGMYKINMCTYPDNYDESIYIYGSDGSVTEYYGASFKMKAGETYYISANSDSENAAYSISLSYVSKAIVGLSAKELSETVFDVNDIPTLVGTQLWITYSDGSGESFCLDWNYEYITGTNFSIYFVLYDENDNWAGNGYYTLAAGTYTAYFYVDDVKSEPYTITVKDTSSAGGGSSSGGEGNGNSSGSEGNGSSSGSEGNGNSSGSDGNGSSSGSDGNGSSSGSEGNGSSSGSEGNGSSSGGEGNGSSSGGEGNGSSSGSEGNGSSSGSEGNGNSSGSEGNGSSSGSEGSGSASVEENGGATESTTDDGNKSGPTGGENILKYVYIVIAALAMCLLQKRKFTKE